MTSETTERDAVKNDELSGWVQKEVQKLQAGYRKNEAKAVSQLARLRRAGRTGETGPDVWEFLQEFPEPCVGRGDEPSPHEQAAATAIGLYSIHQQGKRALPMHVNNASLGRALRRLSPTDDLDQALTRSFKVLLTADDYDEVVHHLRGLIKRLRAAEIALDYGALATDLSWIQRADQRERVRRRWARDFYVRSRPAPQENPQDDQTDHETGADQ